MCFGVYKLKKYIILSPVYHLTFICLFLDNMDISSHFIKGMNIPPTFEKTIFVKKWNEMDISS